MMTLTEKEEYKLTIKNLQSKIDYLREQRENLTTYAKKYKPLTDEQVQKILEDTGYSGTGDEVDFICGLRHGEAAHGIK